MAHRGGVALLAAAGCYVVFIAYLRHERRRYMANLTSNALKVMRKRRVAMVPEEDEEDEGGSVWRVHNIVTACELRFEAWLSMSVRGLLSTYAIPSIASTLQTTSGFKSDLHRRYADMELLIREFNENAADGTKGWDGQPERADVAIQRLNAIHNKYGKLIRYEDMMYVLLVFMLTPAHFCDSRWSSRAYTDEEKECTYWHWRIIGEKMNLRVSDLFASFDEATKWKRNYEQKHMRYTNANREVAMSTIEYFLQGQVPRYLHVLARPLVSHIIATCQETSEHASALGLPRPYIWLSLFVDAVLTAKAFLCAYLVPPLPVAWKDRLTTQHATSPSASAINTCPFARYTITRPLDFGNQTYSQTKSYSLQEMGPASVSKGTLETKPVYLGTGLGLG